jgi:nitrite reductase/ring-hydroxylating ferredoxin subunit
VPFHKIASEAEVQPGKPAVAYIEGIDVAVMRVDDQLYAFDRFCPHARGDLSDGDVIDGQLTCPDHGWYFDIETGRCLKKNGTDIRRFPLRVVDGMIEVEL